MHHRRSGVVCLSLVAFSLAGLGCGSDPAPTPAAAAQPERIELKLDGRPAVPEPAPEDVDWRSIDYDVLAPSRDDGRPTFSNVWFTIHQDNWRRILEPLAGRPDLRYLEVGVFEGRALLWLFENVFTHPSTTAVGVDLFAFEGLRERFLENLERAGLQDRVTTLTGYSNEVLRGLEPRSFDLVYIDASHIAPDVLRDAVLSWELLKDGGYLIFDDYFYTPNFALEVRPGAAIDSFITAFRDEIRVVHREAQVVLRREADPCPGYCSQLGPYEYHWNWKEVPEPGDLFDPRTKARVPLTREELGLVELLLRSRPFGQMDYYLPPDLAKDERIRKLREKLDI